MELRPASVGEREHFLLGAPVRHLNETSLDQLVEPQRPILKVGLSTIPVHAVTQTVNEAALIQYGFEALPEQLAVPLNLLQEKAVRGGFDPEMLEAWIAKQVRP